MKVIEIFQLVADIKKEATKIQRKRRSICKLFVGYLIFLLYFGFFRVENLK